MSKIRNGVKNKEGITMVQLNAWISDDIDEKVDFFIKNKVFMYRSDVVKEGLRLVFEKYKK